MMGMNKRLGGAFLAVGAPALIAGLLLAPSASAATATAATVARTPPLPVQARVSTSRPKDRSTEYIEVTTVKGAKVTAVAHFRTGTETAPPRPTRAVTPSSPTRSATPRPATGSW